MKYLKKFNESKEEHPLYKEWDPIFDVLYKEGVKVVISFIENHIEKGKLVIILHDIKSIKPGMGKKGMYELTNFADTHKLDIYLIASPSYGSDLDRLVKFYEKFGFINMGKYSNMGYEMKREYK